MSPLHIAPHLQRALDTMSKDLAIDPQALVNQALFAWLRINGYVLPAASARVTTNPELGAVPPAASNASLPIPPHVSRASPVPLASIPAPATGSMPAHRPEPAPAAAAPPVSVAVVPAVVPAPLSAAPVVPPSLVPAGAPVVAGPVVAVDPSAPHVVRMKEIAADLEELTQPWPDWMADAPSNAPDGDEDEADEDEVAQDEEVADEATPESAAREEEDQLPPDDKEPSPSEEPAAAAGPVPSQLGEDPFEATSIRSTTQQERIDENTGENDLDAPREEELDEGPPPDSTVVLRSVPIVLYLERDGEEPIRIERERFIIGRGPTCDLIIDSPRVSREHVVLTREGVRYFIEDLNSSNGTWLGEERLTKREIESGDLISLGNEPVTFILRGE
jgi:hypothetical protein